MQCEVRKWYVQSLQHHNGQKTNNTTDKKKMREGKFRGRRDN